MKRSQVLGTLAVFLLSIAYFSAFRAFGFQVEDEGTLLFQLDRVLRGQRPYLDFHTGYTPGFFRVGSLLLAASASEVVQLRLWVAGINGFTVAAMYALLRPSVGPWLAVIAPVAWMTFIPVFPGDFASFNIPYPAWFAAAIYAACALVMQSLVARGGYARVLVAGILAAAAFAFKINAGAFLLAGCTFILCIAGRVESRVDSAIGATAATFMALGIVASFLDHPTLVDVAIHVVPALCLAIAAGFPLRGRLAHPRSPRLSIALAMLAIGFIVPTLSWVLPLLGAMGIDGFLREVLLIGSGAAAIYHEDHPPPELYAGIVTAGVLVVGIATGLVVRRKISPDATLASLALLAALATAVPLAMSSVMPEGFAASVGYQLENAAFWLAPLVNALGVFLLCTSVSGRHSGAAQLVVVVPFAVTMYLQLYPRTDFMHVIMAVPMTACLANVLLWRVMTRWQEADWSSGGVGRVAASCGLLALTAFVLVARVFPFASAAGVGCDESPVSSNRLGVCVEPQAADDLVDFQRTIDYLGARTRRGEAVLAFPALSGALFGAQLTSPVPHDYWFPGRPDRAGAAEIEHALRRSPPQFVVALNSMWNFFIDAPEYFDGMREFVQGEYRLAARFGRYDVLARGRDSAESFASSGERHGTLEAAIVSGAAARRQGVRRLLAGLTPEVALSLKLPDDAVRAILVLRGVRDAGDLRLTGLIIQGYARPEPRVRREALGAMYLTVASTRASLQRWAGDVTRDAYRPYVEPWLDGLRALDSGVEPRAREFARLALEIHGST